MGSLILSLAIILTVGQHSLLPYTRALNDKLIETNILNTSIAGKVDIASDAASKSFYVLQTDKGQTNVTAYSFQGIRRRAWVFPSTKRITSQLFMVNGELSMVAREPSGATERFWFTTQSNKPIIHREPITDFSEYDRSLSPDRDAKIRKLWKTMDVMPKRPAKPNIGNPGLLYDELCTNVTWMNRNISAASVEGDAVIFGKRDLTKMEAALDSIPADSFSMIDYIARYELGMRGDQRHGAEALTVHVEKNGSDGVAAVGCRWNGRLKTVWLKLYRYGPSIIKIGDGLLARPIIHFKVAAHKPANKPVIKLFHRAGTASLAKWMKTQSTNWQTASFKVDAVRSEPLYYLKKGESTDYHYVVSAKSPNMLAIRSVPPWPSAFIEEAQKSDKNATKELVSNGRTELNIDRGRDYYPTMGLYWAESTISAFGWRVLDGTRRLPPQVIGLDLIFPTSPYSSWPFTGCKTTAKSNILTFQVVILGGETIIEWELTVGRHSRLPERLEEYRTERGGARLRTLVVKYSNWQFDKKLPSDTFWLDPPKAVGQFSRGAAF